ncbi:stalk domain-containing protein [Desulfoscipio gibsoniae]|uniref:Major membrane immunogen, membrane-anchored lipoprotein n=1 Tax=Desulfoscipio gibsoniae DSM 7213 TaxID=767817 RepID=R4KE11_9FIRM|nr:stalk domain-containing protein [Desulfoscipio gibsoniae]AGK99906.1 major membrane immunogen, membrane-anchored lipoprotein [Desulfoscipio gibsoniae DSM 7213]
MKSRKICTAAIITAIAIFACTGLVSAGTEGLQAIAAKFNFNINGQNITLPEQQQPVVIDGKTYLPVRAMGEVLEKRIGWNQQTKTVYVGDLLQDGIYKAAGDDFDEHGWKGEVEITVVDGKIDNAKYDEINEQGVYKSADEAYLQQFKEITKVDLIQSYTTLQNSLIEVQNPDMVDTVSGATGASNNFKMLANEALTAGPLLEGQ